MPTWVAVFMVAIVGWRGWISWAARRAPSRWIMYAITIVATYGTYLTYQRIFGREAGVTLLVLMAALKLLEMRNQRDVVLSIYLGFFLVMTNFLFSQTIPMGLYMLVCVWVFVATLVGFNRVGRSPTLAERLRPAGALLLQALPLMVAFFILFPRTTGPLWALPQDSLAAQTGLSESMTPGNIANLIKSDALAFRVQFEDGLPPYRSLYWRGPVMVDFDGQPGDAGVRGTGPPDYGAASARPSTGDAGAPQQDVALRARRSRIATRRHLGSPTCNCATAADQRAHAREITCT
jgi:hypothetical protein